MTETRLWVTDLSGKTGTVALPCSRSGGLQVADAPLARQSSAASGKPARLGGMARRTRTSFDSVDIPFSSDGCCSPRLQTRGFSMQMASKPSSGLTGTSYNFGAAGQVKTQHHKESQQSHAISGLLSWRGRFALCGPERVARRRRAKVPHICGGRIRTSRPRAHRRARGRSGRDCRRR
jgi:hypothetical protein